MSQTVAHALRQENSDEYEETADFIEIFDKFFDSLNTSSITGGQKKGKINRYPYRTSSDSRLAVSTNSQVHLHYVTTFKVVTTLSLSCDKLLTGNLIGVVSLLCIIILTMHKYIRACS